MPRLNVKVVGIPFAKWWNKTAPRLMTWRQSCHRLRKVISFRRFSHTSRRHNVSMKSTMLMSIHRLTLQKYKNLFKYQKKRSPTLHLLPRESQSGCCAARKRSTVRPLRPDFRTVLRCHSDIACSAARPNIIFGVCVRQLAALAISWRDHRPSWGSSVKLFVRISPCALSCRGAR